LRLSLLKVAKNRVYNFLWGGGALIYPHPVITGTVEGEAKMRLGAKWRKYGNTEKRKRKCGNLVPRNVFVLQFCITFHRRLIASSENHTN
jgi:hypothetical protein